MSKKEIIATNGTETMTLEDFLLWELEGGKGNVLADGTLKEWESLTLETKIRNMAQSMRGDMLEIVNPWKIIVMTVE